MSDDPQREDFRRWAGSNKRQRKAWRFVDQQSAGTSSGSAKKSDKFWRGWLIFVAIAGLFIGLAAINPPKQNPVRSDALLLMKAGLSPLAVAGLCNKDVAADPSMRQAAEEWNQRNQIYMERILAAIKATGDMTRKQKTELERNILQQVKQTVESQPDKVRYCAEHAQLFRGGMLDLHRNPESAEAMRRLMTVDLTSARIRDLNGQWKSSSE